MALLLAPKPFQERLTAYFKMRGHIGKNGREVPMRSGICWGIVSMMLTMLVRDESKVTALRQNESAGPLRQ